MQCKVQASLRSGKTRPCMRANFLIRSGLWASPLTSYCRARSLNLQRDARKMLKILAKETEEDAPPQGADEVLGFALPIAGLGAS